MEQIGQKLGKQISKHGFLITFIAGVLLALITIYLILTWSFDSETWNLKAKNKEKARYRRGFISSNITAFLQNGGQLSLSTLDISQSTILSVYNIVWSNTFAFVFDVVIASDDGQHLLQTKGRKKAFERGFGTLNTRKFLKYLIVIGIDMCISSFLMAHASPIVDKMQMPAKIPRSIAHLISTILIGNLCFFVYGNYLRVNWALTEDDDQKDKIVSLSALLVALFYVLQKNNDDNILETRGGRLSVCLTLMILVAFLNLKIPGNVSTRTGLVIFIIISTIVSFVLSKASQKGNKSLLWAGLNVLLSSPVLTTV